MYIRQALTGAALRDGVEVEIGFEQLFESMVMRLLMGIGSRLTSVGLD